MHRAFRETTARRHRRTSALLGALVMAVALTACAKSTTPKATTTTRRTVAIPTTTTVPCVAQPSHASAGSAVMTVDPGTCLKGGQVVTITASGLHANSAGGIAECNGAGSQPTISVEGNQVPVSCTNPLAQIVSTSSTGTLDATFKIVTGYTGPPATGTDSAGTQAIADAANFPCPPTAAQQAAGATCTIAFGDAAGDELSAPITFVANVKPTSTKPGSNLTPSIPSL